MRLGWGMAFVDAWKVIWSTRAVNNDAPSTGATGIGSASACGAVASARLPTAATMARRAFMDEPTSAFPCSASGTASGLGQRLDGGGQRVDRVGLGIRSGLGLRRG